MENRNLDGILWYKRKDGYWHNRKFGLQHVYVWQQAHQATVDKGDVIHHWDRDRSNNQIENLQLMTNEEHTRLHASNPTDETRAKMSFSRSGKSVSEMTRKRMSQSQKGRTFSPESIVKMSEAKLGKNQSSETREKIASIQHKAGLRTDNKSGFRGVCYDKSRGKYIAYIYAKGKRVHLGRFSSAEEAALAFDFAARMHWGEAYQNINQDNPEVVNDA